MVGSSLTVILQLDRTTVMDVSIRPASKDSKFYYTTHCKDEFYLSGTHRCVPYGSSNQQATKGKRTTHHRSDELYYNFKF